MSQPEDAGERVPLAAPLTAGDILDDAAAQLQAVAGGDVELTNILKTHILVEAPARDGADMALKAIVTLAEARAKAKAQPTPTPENSAND